MEDPKQPEEAPKEQSPIEQAQAVLDQLKAEKEEIIKQKQELQAERMLSGKAEAGVPAPEEKEETPKEYAEKVMKGEIK